MSDFEDARQVAERVLGIQIIGPRDNVIIPPKGILRKMYNEAKNCTYEYSSSHLFQIILQKTFFEYIFAVVCEAPPDRTLRRVDTVIRLYDPDHDTITSIVYTESKGPNASGKDAEDQALDAAMRAMEHDNLTGVYAITTVGTTFKFWYTSRGMNLLESLHENSDYIELDSPECRELIECARLIKSDNPLRVPRVMPSNDR